MTYHYRFYVPTIELSFTVKIDRKGNYELAASLFVDSVYMQYVHSAVCMQYYLGESKLYELSTFKSQQRHQYNWNYKDFRH